MLKHRPQKKQSAQKWPYFAPFPGAKKCREKQKTKQKTNKLFWAVAKTRYNLLEYGQSKVQGRTEYN